MIQVFTVNHKQNLIHPLHLGNQLRGLKTSQGFPAAGSVPNIATGLNSAQLLIIGSDLYPVNNPFCRHNLIGTKHHQVLLGSKHTIFRDHIE